MKKSAAISIFSSGTALAAAVGLTKQAISQWPEELNQARSDMVIGAAIRLKRISAKEAAALLQQERVAA